MNTNIVTKAKEKYLEYENRHEEILEAAVRVFNQKGYKGATTAEIARAAGVVEPTLYQHFKNKKGLFLVCFRSITEELMSRYREVYKNNQGDEIGYLEGVIRAFVDFVRNNSNKSKFLVHLLSYRDDPELEKVFMAFMQTSITTVERMLISAQRRKKIELKGDPRILASMFTCQYFTVIALFELVEADRINDDIFIQVMRAFIKAEPPGEKP